MFTVLEAAIEAELLKMELYIEIGCLVCARPERCVSVIAARHLTRDTQDSSGFSLINEQIMCIFFLNTGQIDGLPKKIVDFFMLVFLSRRAEDGRKNTAQTCGVFCIYRGGLFPAKHRIQEVPSGFRLEELCSSLLNILCAVRGLIGVD